MDKGINQPLVNQRMDKGINQPLVNQRLKNQRLDKAINQGDKKGALSGKTFQVFKSTHGQPCLLPVLIHFVIRRLNGQKILRISVHLGVQLLWILGPSVLPYPMSPRLNPRALLACLEPINNKPLCFTEKLDCF